MNIECVQDSFLSSVAVRFVVVRHCLEEPVQQVPWIGMMTPLEDHHRATEASCLGQP